MARPKADDPTNRRRILAAAERAFAEQGFDAAGVADIAARAGVNKALIYYYFRNKDAIREEIIVSFVAACMEQSVAQARTLAHDTSGTRVHEYLHSSIRFLEESQDILRIMVMESLKKSRRIPHLIRAMRPDGDAGPGRTGAEAIRQLRNHGIAIETDMQKVMVNEFFTKSIPTMMFVMLRRAWATHFGVPEAELVEWFIEALEATHVAYHRSARSSYNRRRHHVGRNQ